MEKLSQKLAQSIMERTPLLYEEKWYKGKWSYDYGVVLKGFQLFGRKRTNRNILISSKQISIILFKRMGLFVAIA